MRIRPTPAAARNGLYEGDGMLSAGGEIYESVLITNYEARRATSGNRARLIRRHLQSGIVKSEASTS